MKTKKLYFIALILYFIGNAAYAQTAEHKTYDYITLLAEKERHRKIYISDNGVKYEKKELADPQGDFDYSEVIKIIKQYEKEGYEVVNNNMASYTVSMSGSTTYNY